MQPVSAFQGVTKEDREGRQVVWYCRPSVAREVPDASDGTARHPIRVLRISAYDTEEEAGHIWNQFQVALRLG